ncbi:hypothetical protein C4D60_Mb09t09000 [Musa balbisiana]|uniref:non-specific serine/threonine protein kinase n=1 Tax=Musa balbisiana TaxID=52838 RepID=A0A4S8IF21_MUSBA|nr:hypothetical protein C4D60_Mb09t09000 [Musa balbisiana]
MTEMPAMLLNTWVVCLLLLHPSLAGGNHDFVFNGFGGSNLTLGGVASITSGGLLMLTNNTKEKMGHAFYPSPLRFGDLPNGTVFSFSTTFVTAFISEYADFSSHGVAFVVSPTKDFSRALGSQYLGLFNRSNDGNSSNHVLAIELDTINNPEFQDIDDNHVGIDINSLTSMDSHTAGYYADDTGLFKSLRFSSGQATQVWIDYDGQEMLLNVSLSPIPMAKPHKPLLSTVIDLSSLLSESMYVGFASSTGPALTSHYVLGWSFTLNGAVARDLDYSLLPSLPRTKSNVRSKVLHIGLPLASITLVSVIVVIVVFIVRWKIKYAELLEDWELEYGPYRFSYKDLFGATKGFMDEDLLGRGGFGRVYKGVIVHRDIKASNVLLDRELNGRLGDFGLARLYDHGTDPKTTRVVGTIGYLAPELPRTGKATTVTDVFAFGVFLLEVVCGRRPVERMAAEEQLVLSDWVLENWRNGTILATRDPRLGEEYVVEEVELVLKLGLLCSHPLPTARPSMRQVVRYLEGHAPLAELSPTYLSFSVYVQVHNEGADDHITSYTSSVASASVISGGR